MKKYDISKVLSDINKRVPELLRKRAVSEVKKTPTMEFVVDEIISKNLLPQDKINQLKVLKESGEFSKTKFEENRNVVKQIDNFISREIKKAIKQGLLPSKAELGEEDFIKHIKQNLNG